jgi:Mg2+ and Co2+ transporter CorA
MARLSKPVAVADSASVLYTIVDALTNDIFPVLEAFGDRMECLEHNILLDPTSKNIQQVRSWSKSVVFLCSTFSRSKKITDSFDQARALASQTRGSFWYPELLWLYS